MSNKAVEVVFAVGMVVVGFLAPDWITWSILALVLFLFGAGRVVGGFPGESLLNGLILFCLLLVGDGLAFLLSTDPQSVVTAVQGIDPTPIKASGNLLEQLFTLFGGK